MTTSPEFEAIKGVCETRCDREYVHEKDLEEMVNKIGDKRWMGKLTTGMLWTLVGFIALLVVGIVSAGVDYGKNKQQTINNTSDIIDIKKEIGPLDDVNKTLKVINMRDSIIMSTVLTRK